MISWLIDLEVNISFSKASVLIIKHTFSFSHTFLFFTGFLPAMEAASRGNYGLMDIITALHWVQENIAQFGGDPRNVTLLGHGYGASCAHLLMLSPMSKGIKQNCRCKNLF